MVTKINTMTTQEIYQQEFNLNLKYQIENIKEPTQVGYQIDNYLFFTLIIPKRMWLK